MAKPNPNDESHATVRETAPETIAPVYTPQPPRQMRVERQHNESSPMSRRFPQVRGGICEFCGVMDPNYPSQYQYKMCPHFRGLDLRCSYCPDSKNPEEVVTNSTLNIAEHPDKPGVMIVWCGSYECSQAHIERFKVAVT